MQHDLELLSSHIYCLPKLRIYEVFTPYHPIGLCRPHGTLDYSTDGLSPNSTQKAHGRIHHFLKLLSGVEIDGYPRNLISDSVIKGSKRIRKRHNVDPRRPSVCSIKSWCNKWQSHCSPRGCSDHDLLQCHVATRIRAVHRVGMGIEVFVHTRRKIVVATATFPAWFKGLIEVGRGGFGWGWKKIPDASF